MSFFDRFFPKKRTAPLEKAVQEAMLAEIPRMISHNSVDEDEQIKTPAGAELSYLDSRALGFWNGKRTDFKVPPYYENSAFGRNVGPALDRLLQGGYLEVSDLEGNISLRTVPELKEILSAHKLKVSGKKSELVSRLMDSLPEQKLRELFR